MKKKLLSAVIASFVFVEAGCGFNTPVTQTPTASTDSVEANADNAMELEITGMPDTDGTEMDDKENIFTGWLPDSVTQVKAETKQNEGLRQTIIDYYGIPEDSWEQTKYYYNYVDMNGDGTDEIFAVVILTKDAVNGQEYGARGLILQRSGGGAETEIVQLTCSDGVYTNVADAKVIDSVEGMEGTAIICNDLIKDMESGEFLTLAD